MRAERGPERAAAEESSEAQDTDDEPLAVAGHAEGDDEHDEDQVQQVTRHEPTVYAATAG